MATAVVMWQRMTEGDDVVRRIRIPRDLYDRIRTWRDGLQANPSLVEAIRYVMERGMTSIERTTRK